MTLTKNNATGWAVVTGAASGLGLAIAKELRSDYDLLLIDSNASGLAKASHRIEVVTPPLQQRRARAWLE